MVNAFNCIDRPTADRTRRTQYRRLIMLTFLLSGGMLQATVAIAAPATRVSSDLVQRIQSGDGLETRVIMTGSRSRIEAVAARYGLQVCKWLTASACLKVPAGLLERVANDPDVDQLSPDL